MLYKIKLNQFEGPLDLLLFFIKRDELNIYDIPISKITKDFIQYLNIIQLLDLEMAGDFILMATTLMQIKVRMLLPRETDSKGEEIDPRADLVKALLEYKRYKEVSEDLSFFESQQRKVLYRSNFENDIVENLPEYKTLLKNISVYDLIKVFQKVLLAKVNPVVHEVKKFNVTIDNQISFINQVLSVFEKISFMELIKDMKEKIKIVITFIAILEMIKAGIIGLYETEIYNDFVIYKIKDGQNLQLDY